jgi:hypothetical protein
MPATKTIDLRGAAGTPGARGAAVLADPTGRRARRMRLAGRLVAAGFTFWLSALVLAGLGLLPTGSVPFAQRIHAGAAPPALSRDHPFVARAGTPPVLAPTMASAAADRAAPGRSARARTTRPASGRAPSRTKYTAARKRPATGTVSLATATHAGNPHPVTPRATATPKPSHGKSGTAPGHTRTPRGQATRTPTATGTLAPMSPPKLHGHAGGNGTRGT